jgi:capsular polysaccharide biosynthesis protein
MEWAIPRQLPPTTTERAQAPWVDHATITPFRTGELRVVDRDWKWVTGAVYDAAGDLVPQSQRFWAEDSPQPVAADPAQIRPNSQVERSLEGDWVFAGHWHGHFGHFLTETLTNLWPVQALSADGIVGMRIGVRAPVSFGSAGIRPLEPKPWMQELLALAGLGGREILISHLKAVRVERLLVPERPVLIKHWVRPEAVELWRRISDTVGELGASRRVFLSRSRFNATVGHGGRPPRTDPEWDALMDRSFAAAGFDLVYPEELSISEQIAIVRGVEVLAASKGSALHLSCFTRPGTKVLEVGEPGRRDPPPTQCAIDAACGNPFAYLQHGDRDALGRLKAFVEDDPVASGPSHPDAVSRLRRRVHG